MCIAKRTVEFHIDNAQSKLGVQSRVEAAVKATILGLIDPRELPRGNSVAVG